jgi:arylsulfatase A-like enzyme
MSTPPAGGTAGERSGEPSRGRSHRQKNLLLVVVDCARTEKTIAALPHATPFTRRSARLPFLDSLRGMGTTWSHLCAVSSTTTPNIASMFTGRLPVHHGIREHSRHSLRIDVPTVTELLRRAGYHTYAEVTGPLIREAGLARGFGYYRCRQSSEYLHTGLIEQLERLLLGLVEPWFVCLHLWEGHMPYQNPPPFDTMQSGYTPHDRALTFIDECLTRLFLDLDLERTSVVYTADHGERLAEDYEVLSAGGSTDAALLETWQEFYAAHGEPFPFDHWYEHLLERFGEVTARIHAHGVVGHGFHLTEDLIRVPLVIVDPDRCAARETRHDLRSQRDLGATLLDLAGVEQAGDDRLAGRSLLERGGDETVYVEANGGGGRQFRSRCYLRGARTQRWKYWRIESRGLEHRVLWDLDQDPRETRDVGDAHPEVRAELDRFVDRSLRFDEATLPASSTGRENAARDGDPAAGDAAASDTAAGDAIEARLKELGYL